MRDMNDLRIIMCHADEALTHCGLVTPYGGKDLGRHWFRFGFLPDGTRPLPKPMLTYRH